MRVATAKKLTCISFSFALLSSNSSTMNFLNLASTSLSFSAINFTTILEQNALGAALSASRSKNVEACYQMKV